MREVGGAHEGIFSHMLQQIIEILVSLPSSRTPVKEFFRIAVVAPIDRIIDGAPLPCREKYGGRLDPAPDLLHRVGNPGGAASPGSQAAAWENA